jgi:hypothetical protein
MVQQPLVGQGLLIIEASRLHSDTPHPQRFLWTSDQPDAENSTWQHTTFTRDRQHASGGIRTRNPSKRAAARWHLRPRGHWDRLQNVGFICIKIRKYVYLQAIKARRPRNQNLIPFWEKRDLSSPKSKDQVWATQLTIGRVPDHLSAEKSGRGLQIDDKPPPSA